MIIQGALPSKIVEDVYFFDAVIEIVLAMNRLEGSYVATRENRDPQ